MREARPPANKGDDRHSSSHHDEIAGAEITLNNSEFNNDSPIKINIKRGSSPGGSNLRQSISN